MLKNCLKVAWRSVVAQKLYSAINIAGLAVGVACFILIGLFVQHELSYDHHWANGERIYRIARDYAATETIEEAHLDAMPAPAAPQLQQDFRGIAHVARLMCCGVNGESADGEFFTEWGYADADNALFDIFDFDWISGDPTTALTEPFDLVLTRSAARRHFADADPLGQTLLLQWGPPSNRLPRVVKGVIEDLPDNTHLPFDMLGSMQSWSAEEITEQAFNDWSYNAFQTYVLLREDADVAAIENGSPAFFERHVEEGAEGYMSFTAERVADIHLRSNRENIYGYALLKGGSLAAVYAFGAIGIFILLLACINFMNLATSRSLQRGKEIGVRKVMGASRQSVGLQFLAESMFLVVFSVLAGLMLVELALPSLNAFLAMDLTVDYAGDPRTVVALTGLTVAVGVLAGGYPAFYLAQFQAARVLRGDMTRGAGAARFRETLVILQFSIAIVLLIATATMEAQMRFARNVDPGYDMSQIVLSGVNVQPQRWEALKREWLAHPGISHVTASNPTPFDLNGPGPAEIRTEAPDSPRRNMDFVMVDYDFFETYRISLLAGRSFSGEVGDRPEAADDGSITTPFIISVSAAAQFGWTPQEALGQWLDMAIPAASPEYAWAGAASGLVVGVVDDVRWESAHAPVQPLVYRMYREGQAGVASLRITGQDLEGTFAWIDQKWKELGPAFPIARTLVDQRFATVYQNEQRQAQLLTVFSALAILISCLGLYGLASFNAERRTREIGVRKVVGGSVWSIVLLLTNEFSKLVLVSNVIAWPVAYFVMNRWLETFAYRIDLTPLIFIGSGLIALCIAWVTVGGTAAKVANQKPVLALRYE